MAGLGSLGTWRHAVVAASVLGGAALALAGLIGTDRSEGFDGKQVTVTPTGDDGLRIREVVDQDFGRHDRHGYERIIPNDFGVPTDIEASSPDAPADPDGRGHAGGRDADQRSATPTRPCPGSTATC